MPVILEAVLTDDQYDLSGAAFPAERNTRQITFVGTGAAFYARFYKINPSDPTSQPVLDGVERLYPAGSGDSLAQNIAGADFRSAVPGVPATIYGQQAFATDIISASPAFGGGTQACCGGGGGSLDTTDGVTSVDPTSQLFIDVGIALVDGGAGQARISANLDSPDGSITVDASGGPTAPVHLTTTVPPLDVTDGATTVNPATELLIGAGLVLSNPSPGVAQLDAAVTAAGWQFNTDNEGGWGFVRSNAAITGIGGGYDGFGLALVDGTNDGILFDSDNTVNVNTVQNGNFVFGQPLNSQQFTVNAPVTVSGPTGATAATRYVGATASGAPVTGTFAVGDFVVAQDGHIFVCTAAGTPGTWADVGGGGSGGIQFGISNTGTYLDITTTANDGGGQAILLHDTDATGGITIESDNGAIDVLATAGTVKIEAAGNDGSARAIRIHNASPDSTLNIEDDTEGIYILSGSGFIELGTDGTQGVYVGQSNVDKVGFYGTVPIGQQAGAGITTVAQLVTVLQNLGLLS